jgi:DhnA family fructose-bisphosphate aldolase class Ia
LTAVAFNFAMTDLAFDTLRETRANDPHAVVRAAASRRRRPLLGSDGRLMLVAADHAARGALDVGGRSGVMGDRYELLQRLMTALGRPGVDGVLGTADILEDLLLLGALDDKVVIGSMNRGGLLGASFEMDDRFTGYDASTIAAMGFDGGKMLTRIDLHDAGTVATLQSCAHAIDDLTDHGVMAMVEPFMSSRVDGKIKNDLSAEAVVLSIGITQGLGRSSRDTWMKLPVVDDMDLVMRSTTLPTLLLGGDPTGPAHETYARWEKALAAPGVRGLIVGRSLLYPADHDVAAAVDLAVAMVHAPTTTS